MALAGIVDLLACPSCGSPLALEQDDRVSRCRHGHSFDVARQGYLNLTRPDRSGRLRADTAEMVAARERFLGRGHYRSLAEQVSRLLGDSVGEHPRPRLLDVGAGTGYYLAHTLDASSDAGAAVGVALDLSVPACRRAARAHPRIGAVVADTWAELPLVTGGLDAISTVFAPRNPAEFARLLRPDGVVLVVGAASEHLREIRGPLELLEIQPDKIERLDASMQPWFRLDRRVDWSEQLDLDATSLAELVGMGPNAFHTDPDRLAETLDRIGPQRVTAAATLSLFRRA